jgi:hypothetical protein
MRGWVGPRVSLGVLEKRKILLLLPGFEPQLVQAVASHDTDYAILVPHLISSLCKRWKGTFQIPAFSVTFLEIIREFKIEGQ